MKAPSHDARIPDVVLERYRLQELPADEAARVTGAIQRDDQLRRRLEALERSDGEIHELIAPEEMAASVRARLAEIPGTGRFAARMWPALGAGAILLMVIVAPAAWVRLKPDPGIANRPAAADADADRIKGLRPSIAVYRRTKDGSETLADGAVARPGDLLRVGYRAAGRPYGLILSIDGGGSVTLHLPPAGDRAAPLKRDATVLLDQAYELDDAPLWERFYFVTGDAPFTSAPIMEAARRAAASHPPSPPSGLALPPGLDQSTFSLQKETRP